MRIYIIDIICEFGLPPSPGFYPIISDDLKLLLWKIIIFNYLFFLKYLEMFANRTDANETSFLKGNFKNRQLLRSFKVKFL